MQLLVVLALVGAAVSADPIVGNPGPCANDPCACCDSFGNVYRPVYSTQCRNFTQSAGGVTYDPMSCRPGLVFDINKCVCNWPSVSAACGCQAQPFVAKKSAAPIQHKPVKFSPDSVKVNSCTCYERGNYYSPVSANGCASFTQRTAFLPAVEQDCPAGLIFDVDECVCNWPAAANCPANCQGGAANPPVNDDFCESHGNTYAPVPGTNCAQFTQATDLLPPQTHSCPAGLMFDTNLCVCNWPRDTVCRV